MPIALTAQQQQALNAVEWLYSDESRRTGRSFLIALVLLRQMVQHPGEWIRICDHVPMLQLNVCLRDKVLDLANDLEISEGVERRHSLGRHDFDELRLRHDYVMPDSVMTALTHFEIRSKPLMPISASSLPTSSSIDLKPKITLWDVIREVDASTEKEDLFYCYMVKTRFGKLYTGIAKDVQARINKHNKGKGSKCLKGQLPVDLVWISKAMPKSEASKLEYKIKQLSHSDKWRFIEKNL